MNDPFEILGISPDAGDADIRRRYLELVREFPPDRAPEKFAAIREAYEEVRDPVRRLDKQIFSTGTRDSIEALAADLRSRLREARLPMDSVLSLADSR